MRRRGALGRGIFALWLAPGALAVGGDSCWIDGYSSEFCCDTKYGPAGNEACWDDRFTYEPCCTSNLQAEKIGGTLEAVGSEAADVDFGVLERALKPKIGQILAEGEAADDNFATEFEGNLRKALTSAENRTIARQDAVMYLAVFLRIRGRYDEAEQVLRENTLSRSLEISTSGAWVGTDAEGYHMHDGVLAEALANFFVAQGASTVGDFGCGLGLYVRDFRAAGLRSGGFDGNPSTAALSEGRCQVADLSSELDFGNRWDWVLSLEVAEHIPREFEMTFLRNLDRHARHGIVLSWGNQGGEGHVNVRPRWEVEELLRGFGLESADSDAAEFRSVATLPWFKETILVFRRMHPVKSHLYDTAH